MTAGLPVGPATVACKVSTVSGIYWTCLGHLSVIPCVHIVEFTLRAGFFPCFPQLITSMGSFHIWHKWEFLSSLQWCHKHRRGVSNHQHQNCLLNHLFRCKSKKTAKLHFTGLCAGNSLEIGQSPHKVRVMRKMFPFDDVIMMFNEIWVWPISSKSFGHVFATKHC